MGKQRIPRICLNCGIEFSVKPSQIVHAGAIYCGTRCKGIYEGRIKKSKTVTDRILPYIDWALDPPCCIWKGSISASGHGRITLGDGTRRKIHRVIWEIFYDPIPEGLYVLHNCPEGKDNPLCVNIEHLYLGTLTENIERRKINKIRKSHPKKSVEAYASIEDVFWKNIIRSDDPDECWFWAGDPEDPKRYGRLRYMNKEYDAHRFSYMIHIGEIPNGFYVLHNCPGGDEYKCVNPRHLWIGTHHNNMKDATIKHQHAHGSNHYRSILKEKDIVEIRNFYRLGYNYVEIGEMFQVSKNTIRQIVSRKTWKHVK